MKPQQATGRPLSADEQDVCGLYHQILEAWNDRDAGAMAALFTEDGDMIGFDGSQFKGRAGIATHLDEVFTSHRTGTYVGKVKYGRFLGPDVAVINAVAGMVLFGESDINPALNTIHTLVAVRQNDAWRVAVLQSTPAQFHGRPEQAHKLTNELRQMIKQVEQ